MSKKQFTSIALILGFVALILGAYLYQPNKQTAQTGYPGLGGEFTLNSDQGSVSLSQFKGKISVIYFGYTFCPDVCPTSLSAMGQAIKKFSAEDQTHIQPLFISVDPERDTTKRLAEYTKHFHPKMIGLNSDLATTHIVAKNYGVFFAKANMGNSAVDYAMDHSSVIFVIGPNGVVQKLVKSSDSVDAIYNAINSTLIQL